MSATPRWLLVIAVQLCAASGLENQRVVVTGGGRGIGRAIALLCAEEGAQVAILARSLEELQATAAIGVARGCPHMLVHAADVTDEAAVEQAIGAIAEEMGGIDLLINNAGGSCKKGPLHEQSVQASSQLIVAVLASPPSQHPATMITLHPAKM